MRPFSSTFAGCCLLVACGAVQRARSAPTSPATAAAAPRPAAAPTVEPDAPGEAPETEEEVEPKAPVDPRPVGIADCAGTEVAEMLVVTSDQAGAPTPDEVAQGPGEVSTCYVSHSGCAVKRVAGVWVNAGGKLWQLSTKPLKLRTGACPGGPDEARPAGVGSAERVELAADGGHQVVVNPPPRASENEYEETTRFVASIATTLYFKTTTYTNFCGAHGYTTSRYFAHDLLGVKGRYFSEEPTDNAELLQQAGALFKSDVATSHPFQYATTLPYYAEGALHFVAQLTAGSTHVESDGLRGPYERSVFLPTAWLGVNFAYVSRPPPALAAAVATRNVRVYGWSLLGDAGLAPTSRYKDWTR